MAVKARGAHIKTLWPDRVFMSAVYAFLIISVSVVIYPLVFVVSASFSSTSAVLTGRVWLLPVEPTLFSFETAFKFKDIWTGYINSLVYMIVGTAVATVMTTLAAFPLSRRDFYGRKIFTAVFLFTMIFSGGIIPTYIQMKLYGLLNTRWAIILPNAVAIWLVIISRTFFQQNIPEELYEAAELDGSSDFGFLFKVVLPLSGPIIAVVALNYAVWLWNSYFDALLYFTDRGLFPLQLVMRDILILSEIDVSNIASIESAIRKQGLATVLKYAMIVMSSAPLLIAYPFVQKFFVRGMLVGAVKG
jgi:ABC-type glycerol-3-phosphate transport system permease component